MEELEEEMRTLRSGIETLQQALVHHRNELDYLKQQRSKRRGALHVLGLTGIILTALTTSATWVLLSLTTFEF
ncbi:MAG: hypothetical protein ABJN40_13005 [Sneathiella sp.]